MPEPSDEPCHVLHLQGAEDHVDSSANVHAAAAERGVTRGKWRHVPGSRQR